MPENKNNTRRKNLNLSKAINNIDGIYRSIVETTQEGICITDLKAKIVYVNKRVTEMLGYPAREITGSFLFSYLDKKDRKFIGKNTERRSRGTRERRILKKDGTHLWVLEFISPLTDDNGVLRGHLRMISDIDERKNIEEKLKKAHNELELKVTRRTAELIEKNSRLEEEILERRKIEKHIIRSNVILKLLSKSASYEKFTDAIAKFIRDLTDCRCVGIRILNEEGCIPYKSYTGFSREFLKSENWLSVYTDECACIRVVGGKLRPRYVNVTTPNGSFYCNNTVEFTEGLKNEEKAEYRGACVRHGFRSVAVIPVIYKNKIFGAIHIADKKENMLPRKKIDIIEPLTALIGEGIYRFTLDARRVKAELELTTAQKKLSEAKRLSDIGALAATVAHELRNPLGVIQMAVYNISKKNNNPSLASHLANIEKKVSESSNIINNLLTYSRIRTPHFDKINIFEILNECIDSAYEKFSHYEVSVNKVFDYLKGKIIEADPYQVKEIFSNIINNAYQSLPEKKGEIEIYAPGGRNGNISIYFKDNGCGIAREDLVKVFDPFFTRKSKGTGLGLTICRELLTMHGGRINIDSEKGKWTRVNIEMPSRQNR
ncbi:MAG: ATP-binding protein [bacterium]